MSDKNIKIKIIKAHSTESLEVRIAKFIEENNPIIEKLDFHATQQKEDAYIFIVQYY